MTEKEMIDFCDQWLSAWTGNRPELLISYFDDSAFYLDPAVNEGLNGHDEILPYFKKLLAANPDWVWQRVELFPTEKGFTLKWKAQVPVGQKEIVEYGLDIVEIANGRITRNEVYFDRSRMLRELSKR